MSDLNIVKVVPVVLEKHPNADSLSIVRIDGYVVVARTADWINEDRGAYIPPDNVVDITRPEFKWLDEGIVGRTHYRIKAKRLRGIMSQGLLIPVPKEVIGIKIFGQGPRQGDVESTVQYKFNLGDDVTEYFGVKRYVSAVDLKLDGGDQASGPPTPGPKYDIESWFKYKDALPVGTIVVLTEKIHGTNARFTFQDGHMHAASRTFYRKEATDNLYWRAIYENPWITEFCMKYPGVVLYGEIFGWVQDLRYGAQPGQLWFKAFDVCDRGVFWDWEQFYNKVSDYGRYEDRIVPIIAIGDINDLFIENNMNGKSMIYPGHMREGIVIKPAHEMTDLGLGRVVLKAVSPEYLEKA